MPAGTGFHRQGPRLLEPSCGVNQAVVQLWLELPDICPVGHGSEPACVIDTAAVLLVWIPAPVRPREVESVPIAMMACYLELSAWSVSVAGHAHVAIQPRGVILLLSNGRPDNYNRSWQQAPSGGLAPSRGDIA